MKEGPVSTADHNGSAQNSNDGEWEGLVTRHVATPAMLTALPPVAMLLDR